MSSKHTPGPWDSYTENGKTTCINGDPQFGTIVCEMVNSEADARLIAAAPDMLALIRDVAAKDHGHTMSNPKSLCLFCHARALLARIDGEE